MGEAAQGKGELKETLLQYNIAVTDAAGRTRSTEAVLNDLADTISKTESKQERLRIVFKAFDSEGAALVNMLSEGSEGLNKLRREARDLGIVLDEDLIRNSSVANDKLEALGRVLRVEVTEAVVNLAPLVSGLAETFINLSKAYRGWLGASEEELVAKHLFDQLEALQKEKVRLAEMPIFNDEEIDRSLREITERSLKVIEARIATVRASISKMIAEGFVAEVRPSAGEGLKPPPLLPPPASELEQISRDAHAVWRETWQRISEENASQLRIFGYGQEAEAALHEELEEISRDSHAVWREMWQKQSEENAANLRIFEFSQDTEAFEGIKKTGTQAAQVVASNWSSALQTMGQENKAAFRAFQAFSIAETIIKTYEGAQNAFTALAGIPYIGPVLGAAAAAAAIAAGMARVASIRGTKPAVAARGGIFDRPTLTMFGEEGAEAVVPLVPGRRREAQNILGQILPVVSGRTGGAAVSEVSVVVNFFGDVKLDAEMEDVKRELGYAVKSAVAGAY